MDILGKDHFGRPLYGKSPKEVLIKLNGFDYSKLEVFEALHKKGYIFKYYTDTWKDETFPNGISIETTMVECAIKEGEEPSEANFWYKVAEKEFQKINVKPPLE